VDLTTNIHHCVEDIVKEIFFYMHGIKIMS